MVVFTCNNCGESLQKPKVEKHFQFACRNYKSLTCVDCLKDFIGEAYVEHTKCLTEDERYSAKGTYSNGDVKKGEKKQESWVEMIKSILDKEPNIKPAHRNLLNTICAYTNIPKKKQKFMNFIKSSSGGRVNLRDVEDIWNIIEKYKNEHSKSNQNNGSTSNGNQVSEEKVNGNKENEEKKRKAQETNNKKGAKKQKVDEENVEKITEKCAKKKQKVNKDNLEKNTEKAAKKKQKVDEENLEKITNGKFNFQDKILEILSTKESLSLKKLEKKVLKSYMKFTGESECTPKVLKKFNKKLKKLENVTITDDIVHILKKNN